MFAIDKVQPQLTQHSSAISDFIVEHPQIGSNQDFNTFCTGVVDSWNKESTSRAIQVQYENFANFRQMISDRHENTIETSWGGVAIEHHEHPLVKKYLVVDKGGYLALEKHAEKEEKIEVREGIGILLQRGNETGKLEAHLLQPGEVFEFEPGVEHCIIALNDLLVYEVSQDHRGMDKDLIFLFTPEEK